MPGEQESVLWALLIVATITDLFWGKIFNLLVFPTILLGLICRTWIGGPASVQEASVAIFAAFLFFYPLYLLRVLAAGDAKLLMAVGAWSNSKFVLTLGAYSIVIGAAVGIWILLRKEGLKGSLSTIGDHIGHGAVATSHRMPFAPAFLCSLLFIKTAALCQWHVF